MTKVIGPEGGVVALDGAVLDFPPGALGAEADIRITVLDPNDLAALPAGVTYASAPVAFEPHGLDFDEPVSVVLDYDRAFDEDLVVAKLDDEDDRSWQAGADGSFEDGKATFTLTSFSVWAIVHDPHGRLSGASAGSGGTSSGGQSSGGSSAAGGTNGLGGVGGAAEVPGHLETDDFTGFVREFATVGVTIDANVDSAVSGDDYCVAGEVPNAAPFTSLGGLEITLNETSGGPVGTFEPQLDGIELDLSWTVAADYRLVISDGTESWCAPMPLDPAPQFIHWDLFNADCTLNFGGAAYGREPIRTFRIEATSDGEATVPYGFCLSSVTEEPTGYYDNGSWSGYVYTEATTGATTSHGLASHRQNDDFCITGNIDEGTFGTSMIAFRLAQEEDGGRLGPAGTVLPQTNYLRLDVTNTGTAPAEVVLTNGATEWCTALPAAPPPIWLAWGDFTECSGPGEYDGEPIVAVGVRALGQELVPVSFNLCVDSLLDANMP